jgi:hypothetical protein
MTVWSSHNTQDLISHKTLHSISPSCVQILHSFLLQLDLTFQWCQQLNPATLLPSNILPNPEPPSHDCIQVFDDSLTTFHHTLDTSIPDAPTWFVDGSSTKASTTSAARERYAVVEGHPNSNTYTITETNSLPPTTMSQQAMLLHEHYKGQKIRQLTSIQIQNTHATSSIPTARSGRNGLP